MVQKNREVKHIQRKEENDDLSAIHFFKELQIQRPTA